MKKLRETVGSLRGDPYHVRTIHWDYRDALKCGFNTASLTEVNTPAQDYRMVTLFPEVVSRYFSLISERYRLGIAAAQTTNTASSAVAGLATTTQFFECDIPPFLMSYYLMNPSISPIEVWVEVWCVRRGFLPRYSMAQDYLSVSDNNDYGPVFSSVRWNLDGTQTSLAPHIHNVPLSSTLTPDMYPNDEAKNANALLPHTMQIFSGNSSWRRLRTRSCLVARGLLFLLVESRSFA